jgi:hypothetical protein
MIRKKMPRIRKEDRRASKLKNSEYEDFVVWRWGKIGWKRNSFENGSIVINWIEEFSIKRAALLNSNLAVIIGVNEYKVGWF